MQKSKLKYLVYFSFYKLLTVPNPFISKMKRQFNLNKYLSTEKLWNNFILFVFKYQINLKTKSKIYVFKLKEYLKTFCKIPNCILHKTTQQFNKMQNY